jgi:hypothetical protein
MMIARVEETSMPACSQRELVEHAVREMNGIALHEVEHKDE